MSRLQHTAGVTLCLGPKLSTYTKWSVKAETLINNALYCSMPLLHSGCSGCCSTAECFQRTANAACIQSQTITLQIPCIFQFAYC